MTSSILEPHNQFLEYSYDKYKIFRNNLIKKLKRKYETNLLTKSMKNNRSA